MLARVFEATNLSTVQISLVKEHTQKVRPPRALFCGFPYGLALGKPNNVDFQHRVLAATFSLFDRASGPVLEEFHEDIVPATAPATPMSERPTDPAFELTSLRGYYTRFVEQYGRTAVNLSGIPQTRFRGVVRLLERYVADGSLAGMEHPEGVTALQYLRYVCDDLKAFYREAYLVQHPNADGAQVESWFWHETAMGDLIRRVRDRVKSSDDPYAQAIAFGISRV